MQAAFIAMLPAASTACTEAGYAKLDAWSAAVKAPGVFRPQPDMPPLTLPATIQELEDYVASLGSRTFSDFTGPEDGCAQTSSKLGFNLEFEILEKKILGFDYESQSYMPGYAAHIDASGAVVCIGKRFSYQSFPAIHSSPAREPSS